MISVLLITYPLFFTIDLPKLTLILYSEADVEAALEELVATPIYSEVLPLGHGTQKPNVMRADDGSKEDTKKDPKRGTLTIIQF